MSEFSVSPDLLMAHAGVVRGIANDVDTAADAASQVGIGGVDTYGLICSPVIIPALHAFFGDAVNLVKQAGALGEAYATGLEANSDVYASVDQDAKNALDKLNSDPV